MMDDTFAHDEANAAEEEYLLADAPEEAPAVSKRRKPSLMKVRVMRHVNNLRMGDIIDVPDDELSRALIANKYYKLIEQG